MALSHTATTTRETFQLGPFVVPRVWTGLWQLSSNAWGSAPASKVRQGMNRYVQLGYTAFGKNYGLFDPIRSFLSLQIWCALFLASMSYSLLSIWLVGYHGLQGARTLR